MNLSANPRPHSSKTLRSLLALLCIGLVLLAGGVDLLHSHASITGTDAACSLCSLSHATVLPGTVAHAPAVVEAVFVATQKPTAFAPARYFAFSLYVRPPPVAFPRAL